MSAKCTNQTSNGDSSEDDSLCLFTSYAGLPGLGSAGRSLPLSPLWIGCPSDTGLLPRPRAGPDLTVLPAAESLCVK